MHAHGVMISTLMAALAFGLAGCQESDTPAQARPASAEQRDDRANGDQSSRATRANRSVGQSAAETRDITFDDIKFDIEKDGPFDRSMLTAGIEDLNQQPVRIRGYILPSYQQTGLRQFVLVRDNQECCFGPGAALYDCVLIEMIQGKSTDFSVRPVAVEGVFTVSEVTDPDGKHLAIYHIDGESVE